MSRPAFASLTAALAERADREPGSVVLTFVAADGSAQPLTLAELNSRAEHNALSLAGQGVGAGELIVLLLPHSPELVDVFWGAMRLGALPAILPYPAPSVTADSIAWSGWKPSTSPYNRSERSASATASVVGPMLASG